MGRSVASHERTLSPRFPQSDETYRGEAEWGRSSGWHGNSAKVQALNPEGEKEWRTDGDDLRWRA